jgi:N-acetylglucosamine kinase-like BadF-type ATPase
MASTNTQTFSGDVEIASNLTVDTNTFHVDSVAGRIGIGKTDPIVAVDVSGTINATSLYAGGSEFQGSPWTESGSDIYYTTGAVGIGTNSPAKTLEVQGTLRISNVSTGGGSDLLVTKSTAWLQQQTLTASDAAQGDEFGFSVAISGDGNTAIVGARYEDPGGVSAAGSAYIFTYSGGSWSEQQKIENPDPATSDLFGYSVAISGDGNTALMGVYGDSPGGVSGAGSAYIFTRSGSSWSEQQQLTASDAAQGDYFGYRVAISGDGNTAIVGAYLSSPGGVSRAGSAYIFTYSGGSWSEQQKITAPVPAASDFFGYGVSLSGDGNTALVGANYENAGPGSAYIFTRSGSSWSQQQKIQASDAASQDVFGCAVSLSGDGNTALVGALAEDPGGVTNAGSAYIFTNSGGSWSEQQKLTASDKAASDFFGWSVSISSDGTTAIVGAYDEDPGGVVSAGSAYIFTYSGGSWSEQQKIENPDPAVVDRFGFSVAISGDGNTAIVGAFYDDDAYTDQGSAYIFTLPDYLTSTTPITAEGTVLSFTGQHTCFPDGPMGQGQIVSANKNKYISLNGPLTTGARAINSSESLPVVCLSNVVNDKNVFGVVDRHEQGGTKRVQKSGIGKVTQEKEWGDNRVIVNSIGEGAMWVANTNGNLVSGDYITSSNVAGYGQKQDDDTVHSYTVAKITMDCDFEPEDLPVQVIKKDAQGKNVLDAYGRIQWEDTDRTEKAYRIRYLTTEGQRTDQANAVWTAAYVGCTYHCG